MKKTKLFLTAALFVAGVAGAFATSQLTLEDYLYYPTPTSEPQPTQSSIHCPNFNGECEVLIDGVGLRQLYRVNPATSQIEPVKP